MHARRFFGSIVFAAILVSTLGMAAPFQPIGPYAVIGFWGAGVLAAIFAGALLAAQKWLSCVGSATLVAIIYLVIYATGLEQREIAAGVIIPAHGHPPAWLVVFSILIPAAIIDLVKSHPMWIRGGLIGLLWSAILFGFAHFFIEPEFQYTARDVLIAVGTSVAGGVVSGTIFTLLRENGKDK